MLKCDLDCQCGDMWCNVGEPRWVAVKLDLKNPTQLRQASSDVIVEKIPELGYFYSLNTSSP